MHMQLCLTSTLNEVWYAGNMHAIGCNASATQASDAQAALLTCVLNVPCVHAEIMDATDCSAFCASTTQTSDAPATLLTSIG